MTRRDVALGLGVLAVLGLGCPPDLDPFEVAGDAGPGGRDGAIADGGGDDGAAMDGSRTDGGDREDGGEVGDCPRPHLLVAVEDLGAAGGAHGRIVRRTLDGERCADLTGGGGLTTQPMALVQIADRLFVAGRDGIHVLDPATDRLLTSVPFETTTNPASAFPLFHPTERRTLAAVALRGTVGVNRVLLVDAAGDTLEDWTVGGASADIPAGSTVDDVASNPRDRSGLLVLDSDRWGAAEADPFAGTVASMPPWVNARAGVVLETLEATDQDGTHRLVWTGHDGSDYALYYLDESIPRDDEGFFGPRGCTSLAPCDWQHAVVDPSSDYHYFAVCEREASFETREVVRVAQGGSCEVVLGSEGLGSRPRISRLAVVF